MKRLDIIEEKLVQMREIAKYAKESNQGTEEIETLKDRINNLASQVNALD